MKRVLALSQSLLEGVGFVWLVLEAYYSLSPIAQSKPGFFVSLEAGLLVGIVWFFINGLWISGILRRSIEITSNAFDAEITILFGDLFKQDGCVAVGVNDFFDSSVDDKHVAAKSLHGLMLTTHWAGNIVDWDSQTSRELAGIDPSEVIRTRSEPGKPNRYPIGTTTCVSSKSGRTFLCVAATRTDVASLEVYAAPDDLKLAIHGLLKKARAACSGRALNLPLMGSGLARTGIGPNILVNLILLAIFEESKSRKVTDHIRIILSHEFKNKIDLIAIKEIWG